MAYRNGDGLGASTHYSFPSSPTLGSPYTISLPTSPGLISAMSSYPSVQSSVPCSSPPFSPTGFYPSLKRPRENNQDEDESTRKKSRETFHTVIEDVITRLGRQGSIDDNMQEKIQSAQSVQSDPVRSFVRRRLEISQSKQNLMSFNWLLLYSSVIYTVLNRINLTKGRVVDVYQRAIVHRTTVIESVVGEFGDGYSRSYSEYTMHQWNAYL